MDKTLLNKINEALFLARKMTVLLAFDEKEISSKEKGRLNWVDREEKFEDIFRDIWTITPKSKIKIFNRSKFENICSDIWKEFYELNLVASDELEELGSEISNAISSELSSMGSKLPHDIDSQVSDATRSEKTAISVPAMWNNFSSLVINLERQLEKKFDDMGIGGHPGYPDFEKNIIIITSHLMFSRETLRGFTDLQLTVPDYIQNYAGKCVERTNILYAHFQAYAYERNKLYKGRLKGIEKSIESRIQNRINKENTVQAIVEIHEVKGGSRQLRKDEKQNDKVWEALESEFHFHGKKEKKSISVKRAKSLMYKFSKKENDNPV